MNEDKSYLTEGYSTFCQMLPMLLSTYGEGKEALFCGGEFKGVYETYSEALQEGYKITNKFSVHKITKKTEVATIATPFV
jgi:hypothetical protein